MLNRICARLVASALLAVVGACAHDAFAPSPADPLLSARAIANAIQPLPDGELVTLTFYINHGDCSGLSGFEFVLNDVSLGTHASTVGCVCNSLELQVTLNGPEARAAWNARKGAANVIAVRTTGRSLFVGYIRLVIETANGSATVPLFDATAGSAQTRDLCKGFVVDRRLFERRFGPPFTLPVGDLLSITFFINHNDCELMTGEFTFTMNGVPLGSSRTTVGCSCSTQELQVKFDSPEARAAWRRGSDNTISVHLNDKVVLVAYIRLLVETTGGSATVPLFDAIEGALAKTRSLCEGNVRDQKDFSVTFAPTPPANQPPVANAGADQTAECADAGAQVTLDGSASSDPDNDPLEYHWLEGGIEIASGQTASVHFGMGAHTVTLHIADNHGASADDEVVVSVADRLAPTVTLPMAVAQLWPPNHAMQLVASGISAVDACDPSPTLVVSVTSNETVSGGDGSTTADWQIMNNGDGTFDVLLRAERNGGGNGRLYTITATASDASGNIASRSATVWVPQSQGKKGVEPPRK